LTRSWARSVPDDQNLMRLRLARPPAEHETRPAADDLAVLVQGAVAGDARATRTLIMAVMPAVMRAARGVLGKESPDVEDAAQDAAIGFVRALPQFRFECSVLHFACRVAVRTALNVRRRGLVRGEGRTSTLGHDELPSSAVALHGDANAAARRDALRELFTALPAAQAEALVLHLVVGLTIDETARSCGVPPDTVRSRLRLAKQAMRMRANANPALREALEVSE
jgi:RNA polymerase sigma factor (sigma-70 family)